MDSLTQITLGAACGELVLGRKLGNKAMLLGAIGGTIPDLDVLIGSLFMDELDSLAFHRGPSHSLFFGVLAPFPLAWAYYHFYKRGWHQNAIFRWTQTIIGALLALALFGFIAYGVTQLPSVWGYPLAALSLGYVFYQISRLIKKTASPAVPLHPRRRELYWLFFWAIFTHPILDAFTTYGTQLLLPFSNKRVAWDTIAVADPLYTLPFGIALLAVLNFPKGRRIRRQLTWLGLGWSLLYLGFTVANKVNMNQRFASALDQAEVEAKRYKTNPVLLSNLLWYGIAELEDSYILGYHSLADPQPHFVQLEQVAKQHQLLEAYGDTKAAAVLPWFSDGYYNVLALTPDSLQYNDLRFGALSGSVRNPNDYVFKFFLNPSGNGELNVRQERPNRDDPGQALKYIYDRAMGYTAPQLDSVRIDTVTFSPKR